MRTGRSPHSSYIALYRLHKTFSSVHLYFLIFDTIRLSLRRKKGEKSRDKRETIAKESDVSIKEEEAADSSRNVARARRRGGKRIALAPCWGGIHEPFVVRDWSASRSGAPDLAGTRTRTRALGSDPRELSRFAIAFDERDDARILLLMASYLMLCKIYANALSQSRTRLMKFISLILKRIK